MVIIIGMITAVILFGGMMAAKAVFRHSSGYSSGGYIVMDNDPMDLLYGNVLDDDDKIHQLDYCDAPDLF